MARVLVVDDEPRYRDHIHRALTRDGHDVRTAANGHAAIAVGGTFLPELLIVDWMLEGALHGLHVCEALHALWPEMRTILITGFPSQDLRDDARSFPIVEFVEKPFEMEHLRTRVKAALTASAQFEATCPLSVCRVDADGVIRFANGAAQQWLTATGRSPQGTPFHNVLALAEGADLHVAADRWVPAITRGASPRASHVRARVQSDPPGWLVIMVPAERRHYQDHPSVGLLLDLEPASVQPWPVTGRTLIADDDRWVRQVIAMQIEQRGGACHTAETAEAALRTSQRDPGIELVVVDCDLPGADLDTFVPAVRALLPAARVVGTSGGARALEFLRAGVVDFLMKPWTVRDLADLIVGRIVNCTACGLPLPLRRARAGEQPESWECVGCGGRYWAMLDPDSPGDLQQHVRPVRV